MEIEVGEYVEMRLCLSFLFSYFLEFETSFDIFSPEMRRHQHSNSAGHGCVIPNDVFVRYLTSWLWTSLQSEALT